MKIDSLSKKNLQKILKDAKEDLQFHEKQFAAFPKDGNFIQRNLLSTKIMSDKTLIQRLEKALKNKTT